MNDRKCLKSDRNVVNMPRRERPRANGHKRAAVMFTNYSTTHSQTMYMFEKQSHATMATAPEVELQLKLIIILHAALPDLTCTTA